MVDGDGVRTRIDLAPNETAVLERVPVSATADAPMSVRIDTCGGGQLTITANGQGTLTLTPPDNTPRTFGVNGIQTINLNAGGLPQ